MDTLEHAQLALARVQFIAEIALTADCDKKDLQMALATISHLVDVLLKEHDQHQIPSPIGTKN
ncbi:MULTISPECIES: hypothetical protein [Dickeya]|uniref:hypothetical protein n=1 Tax=Dickeya TaxID=204037 RepID=UPI00117C6B8A|nr:MULTISPECIES: hypothetical protein [Dickeya]TYL43481.1 hypothetical protein FDP13_05890 [Dickeya sp. ws52]